MSIYEKLVAVRKKVEERYSGDSKKVLIDVLNQLMNLAFENNDEIPKEFKVKRYDLGSEPLKIFFDTHFEFEVKSVVRKVNSKPFEIFYEVKLI